MWNKEEKEEIKTIIYWCTKCNTPVIRPKGEMEKCPLCGHRMKILTNSLRPVHPAEVRLIELLRGEDLQGKSVWKGKGTYYVNGKSLRITNKAKVEADDVMLRKELLGKKFDFTFFNSEMERFINANAEHLTYITEEAIEYIQDETKNFEIKDIMVSFSGGKDSTVTSDLVCRALSNERIKHIFGDTTLEIDSTYAYVERMKKNKQIELHIARNNDNNFFEMAKKIGPPTMSGRWCCYMFKTGAVNRKMQELFDGRVLTFYGVRRSESATRANYNRSEEKTESVKIANQRGCSPILYWNDIEVWLYILANKIDFNEAYKWGYNRVGCFCCPNAPIASELMERIYNHKKFTAWMNQVREFGEQAGKEDLDDYVRYGRWKMRHGGQGVAAANSVKIKKTDCTAEEHGRIYELLKNITADFYQLFTPFGTIIDGRKEISEKLVLHPITQEPIISLQPLSERKIKIVTINAKYPKRLHSRLAYQIVKYNACNQCLKCEGLCKFGAIKIKPNKYEIDEKKCKHCQVCVSNKYLAGGCLMCRYLRTRRDL